MHWAPELGCVSDIWRGLSTAGCVLGDWQLERHILPVKSAPSPSCMNYLHTTAFPAPKSTLQPSTPCASWGWTLKCALYFSSVVWSNGAGGAFLTLTERCTEKPPHSTVGLTAHSGHTGSVVHTVFLLQELYFITCTKPNTSTCT